MSPEPQSQALVCGAQGSSLSMLQVAAGHRRGRLQPVRLDAGIWPVPNCLLAGCLACRECAVLSWLRTALMQHSITTRVATASSLG